MTHYAGMARADRGNAPVCDLRSDTVTRPDAGMLAAMSAAEVGDDVYGDDPQVNRLEEELSARLGKEAGLFVPSGTMSNLLALLSHCQRGEEIIVGHGYHVYIDEAAGASVLGGISLCPVPVRADGALDPAVITGAVKEDDFHYAIPRLLSLENTHNGLAVPLADMNAAAEAGRGAGLAVHLDGARFFNAVSALGCSEEDLAGLADTVSICLSKGLGAPVGSVLTGPHDLISRARRWRKMLGGGMRQAGVLAAAGLYALEHNVQRLSEDHARAEALAGALRGLGAGEVSQATNMVFFTPPGGRNLELKSHLAADGVVIAAGASGMIRMVLHKDADDAALEAALTSLMRFYG